MTTGIPLLRTSERKDFRRCPQLWYWAWRCGLVSRSSISDALWFGTGVHIALAGWYCGPGAKRGLHPAATFEGWANGEIRHIKTSEHYGNAREALIEEKLVPAKELGTTLLDEYVKLYGKDERWDIIQPEQTFQIDVADPDDAEAILIRYAGTYDLVYRDAETGWIWLGEHKTAKSITINHLPLDDQAGSYWAVADQHLRAAGLIGSKERLRGINYNFIRKAMPDTRPRNADGHYTNKPVKADYLKALYEVDGWSEAELSKKKLDELDSIAAANHIQVLGEVSKLQPKPLLERHVVTRTAVERSKMISRIQDEAIVMEAYRDGSLPIIKNTTRDCAWCQFYDMCMLDENGGDVADYRRAMYRQRDPYTDHRKSTEE